VAAAGSKALGGDGLTYLDRGGFGVSLLGHCHPVVVVVANMGASRAGLPRGPDAAHLRRQSTLRNMDQHERREERSGWAAQAAEWDTRYSERDGARWSGRPNGRLLAEVSGLTPGRALDVGCGEGADAIWLARNGWTVTAIDISDVALTRARQAAELAGAVVEWVCGDALQAPFPAGSFDLVSMQYPALPKAAGEAAVLALLDAVRPGGLLLAVYHDLTDEHREHIKSQGIDPADYVDADDLGRLLGHEFTIELYTVEPRIDPPPDNPHIADIVLRARRR
jgi:SAM-dependent methyltransferase